ncbi:Uncharacterised protein [Vibrio cholerae]|nr:Uncharacterised protein [Vibrio cholerae]
MTGIVWELRIAEKGWKNSAQKMPSIRRHHASESAISLQDLHGLACFG